MQTTNQARSHVYKSDQAAQSIRNRYQELLRLWPVPNEQQYIPTGQGETFVISSGPKNAPPLVLLHGTMSNAASWMSEASKLAQEFRVYAIDIIGDAGLSAPARPSHTTDAYARWLSDVLDGLGLQATTLIGTSLGGWIALDFATRQPTRVNSLVLITPGGIANKNIIWWALPLLLLGPWGAKIVRERIIGKFREPIIEEEKKFADLTGAIFENMQPRNENHPTFTDAQLNRLTMPVLTLLGGKDVTMDSLRIKARVKQNILNAEVVIYPNARHYIGVQSDAILSFLLK